MKVVPEDGSRARPVAVAGVGLIEIDLGNRRRIRVDAQVDADARRSGTPMIAIPGNVRVEAASVGGLFRFESQQTFFSRKEMAPASGTE